MSGFPGGPSENGDLGLGRSWQRSSARTATAEGGSERARVEGSLPGGSELGGECESTGPGGIEELLVRIWQVQPLEHERHQSHPTVKAPNIPENIYIKDRQSLSSPLSLVMCSLSAAS